MSRDLLTAGALLFGLGLAGCGDGPSSSTPVSPQTTTTTVPAPRFEIETLVTVYRRAADLARWTQNTTTEERLGRILLGVDELSEGTTVLNNEAGRFELQAAIDRVNEQFSEADYVSAFDETRANLDRFFNDADNDGWSVDGRHGEGRDWPHDRDGNDPDGWTAQMIIIVTRL